MTVVTAVEVAASTKKNNGETLINIVLDETGSMMSCRDATISSFNEYVASQKGQDGVCRVTMNLFSDTGGWGLGVSGPSLRNLYTNELVDNVKELNTSNFRPNGGTNLYDAIGVSIRRLEAQLNDQDTVPNVLMVIITDGGENSSKEFSLQNIKDLVKEKEAEGWTFVYLGANQDAWSVGQSFGLSKGQTMTYNTAMMADTMSNVAASTAVFRSTRATGEVAHGTVARGFFDAVKDKED